MASTRTKKIVALALQKTVSSEQSQKPVIYQQKSQNNESNGELSFPSSEQFLVLNDEELIKLANDVVENTMEQNSLLIQDILNDTLNMQIESTAAYSEKQENQVPQISIDISCDNIPGDATNLSCENHCDIDSLRNKGCDKNCDVTSNLEEISLINKQIDENIETRAAADYHVPISALDDNSLVERDLAEEDLENFNVSCAASSKEGNHSRDKRRREKRLRLKGEDYEGIKKNEDGKYHWRTFGKKRVMGETCMSNKCLKTKRGCSQFTDKERQDIFDTFWKTMTSWDMRRSVVATLIDIIEAKKQKESSRRSSTFYYHLKKNSKKILVCKRMFLSTLGLNEWMVRHWCLSDHKNTGMHSVDSDNKTPLRSRVTKTKLSSKVFMKEFLISLPKMPSHYCRASSSKTYLEPVFQGLGDLYREYEKRCLADNVIHLSRSVLSKQVKRQNIALFRPKKDQCDFCLSYASGHVSEKEYQAHQSRKNEARQKKAEDKLLAEENPSTMLVLTLDMQAVKLAPFLKSSAMYYKTKLCIHNYTLYNMVTKDVFCFLWDETQGNIDATNFASLLYQFLEQHKATHPDTTTVILYSDSCGYQNKNTILSNTLLYASVKFELTIIHNYLEKGHTQMEVDSAHSLIERRLKNRDIYLPTDYISICREARPSKPFNVKYLQYGDFLNFNDLKYIRSIRPGYKTGDPTVAELKCLKYSNNGEIFYKLSYKEEWKIFPQRSLNKLNQLRTSLVFDSLYKERLKIKNEKFKHLQELKLGLDEAFWSYYDNIPHY